ncbi:hypothetical protein BUALT_Bualt07G0008700 [Buddleja alternifolia]|uniref:Homeobox-leucine zipper protein n=1 Tax=Buddleja alternifolia TaxID=168488 RepID=A0AAV6X823_9LAMI|nr:hypothetical protein BUALT_Bualt07G0008700 [Buddleja alternifolia]
MANRFEKYQIDALDMAFEESNHLTKRKKIELVSTTGLDMEQIANWFNRKRAHKKARESVGGLERTNAELQQALQDSEEKAKLQKELQESMKRALQESEERESKLQKELQESMKREAELGAKIQHLRQKLRITGGDLSLILSGVGEELVSLWAYKEVGFAPYPVLAESPSADTVFCYLQWRSLVYDCFYKASLLLLPPHDCGYGVSMNQRTDLSGAGLWSITTAVSFLICSGYSPYQVPTECTSTMANRFEQHQVEALKLAFEGSIHLTKEKKIELVEATGLDVEQVTSWFSRKRARKRASETIAQLELAHSELQHALELSHEREAALHDENQCLKRRLTIAEGDEHFGSLMRFVNGY